jgi:hypothetical protein
MSVFLEVLLFKLVSIFVLMLLAPARGRGGERG